MSESRIVYLLGAGASHEAGIPLASEMTQRAVEKLNAAYWPGQPLGQAINYVVSAMVAHRGRKGLRPDELPDIESVVSAVELLSERQDVELAPFVQNWDPSIAGLGRPRLPTGWEDRLRGGLIGGPNFRGNNSELRSAMVDVIRAVVGVGDGQVFSSLHDELLRSLPSLVGLTGDSDLGYLDPLVNLGQGQLTIATLNYDLTIETAAARANVSVSRGIDEWSNAGQLAWDENSIRLIKLHGSIDWWRMVKPSANDLMLSRVVVGVGLPPGQLPCVIFGRREKLRSEGPFLDLRAAFANKLRTASHLVVVGYSFGDEHVNELVRQWIDSDSSRKLVVVDPRFPAQRLRGDTGFQAQLLSELRVRDPLKGTGLSSRLAVLRQKAGEALLSVCGASAERLDELASETS
jgi:hypothetical protein